MVGHACLKGLLYAMLLSSIIASLLLNGLSPQPGRPTALAAPSSYSWTGLRTDTVAIAYSVDERAWYGGTGYLHIKADGPGTYSDAKTATATITVPEGLSAVVYVCGDDRNPVPNGWTVEDKHLVLEVDGRVVYRLGREYWWARCYSKAATLGPGTYEVKLTIGITVRVSSSFERDLHWACMDIRLEGSGTIQAESHATEAALDGDIVLFGSADKTLYALEAKSGTLLWAFQAKGAIFGAPSVAQETVYLGALDGVVYAMDIR